MNIAHGLTEWVASLTTREQNVLCHGSMMCILNNNIINKEILVVDGCNDGNLSFCGRVVIDNHCNLHTSFCYITNPTS
jgi:uncharacterized protein (DUF342 family)